LSNTESLVARLNPACRAALERAAALCVSRTHYEVDLEHLLLPLLESPDTDAARIVQTLGLNHERLALGLQQTLQRLPAGNPRSPVLSSRLIQLLSEASTLASSEFSAPHIRSATLLLALLSTTDLARSLEAVSPEFLKLNPVVLRQQWTQLLSPAEGEITAPNPPAPSTTALAQYTIDLTAAARRGEIDPVVGRDSEVRHLIDILTRRRQNNPILTGEAGVGKTAIVEGFALRIAAGDVPPALRDVSVRTLDMGLLQAGSSVRGEFESRLKAVIAEVRAAVPPIILFIDEAHTLIGGAGDAANLLKPALARGEVRTIAATTHTEYRKYFERDAALARRFQPIRVDEPSEDRAIEMMRALVPALERHHGVRLLDEAVEAAVRLSHRYVTARQLPDKAVSVLDTACARVALAQNATPPGLEDVQRRIASLQTELTALERDAASGTPSGQRLAALREQLAVAETQHADLEDRCQEERRLVARVLELRRQIESGPPNDDGLPHPLRASLDQAAAELAELQGESPLIPACVAARTVAEVIAGWTGIPTGVMLAGEIHALLNLVHLLGERIAGQDHALQAIARRISTARAGLEDEARPTGVFLLTGPSGSGKTETALALAEVLYGGERNAIVINMSEYQEAYSVSSLKGSPPGYVGYGEGGVLTEAVRRRPYSVLLLDEMEKAHPDVIELFYQVFDKGRMEDSQGREIDFRNTIILMTSNAGADDIERAAAMPAPSIEALRRAAAPALRAIFKPAFLGRVTVVPYLPIAPATLRRIVDMKLERIRRRLWQTRRIELTFSDQLADEIAARTSSQAAGARGIDHLLDATLLPEISRHLLNAMAGRIALQSLHASLTAGGAFRFQLGESHGE